MYITRDMNFFLTFLLKDNTLLNKAITRETLNTRSSMILLYYILILPGQTNTVLLSYVYYVNNKMQNY